MWTEGKSPSNLEAPVSEWVCIMMCVYVCVCTQYKASRLFFMKTSLNISVSLFGAGCS